MEEQDSKPSSSSVGLFPFKLFRMLNDAGNEGFDTIVSWIPTTTTSCKRVGDQTRSDGIDISTIHPFRVHKPKEFEKDVMPRYFPRSTKPSYRTFTRSLNHWCFERITDGKLEYRNAYYHPLFKKGQPPKGLVRVKCKAIPAKTVLNSRQGNCKSDCRSESLGTVASSMKRKVCSSKAPPTETTAKMPPRRSPGGNNNDLEPVPILTEAKISFDSFRRLAVVSSASSPFSRAVDQETEEQVDMRLLLLDDAFTPRPIGPESLAALASSGTASNLVGMGHTTAASAAAVASAAATTVAEFDIPASRFLNYTTAAASTSAADAALDNTTSHLLAKEILFQEMKEKVGLHNSLLLEYGKTPSKSN